MRVVALTTSFPHHPDDYRGRFVADWADALAALGARVRVLAPVPYRRREPTGVVVDPWRMPPALRDAHGLPDLLTARPVTTALGGGVATARLALAARRASRGADVVVAHWLLPAGLVAAAVGGRRLHLYAHGADVALLERLPGGAALARHLVARADGLTCVSADLRARLSRLAGAPVEASVLPMGVAVRPAEARRVAHWRARLGMGDRPGGPLVLTVGRLVPIKGLDVLVRALALRPSARWVAAGDGPERARLAAQAAAAGVDVRFVGTVSPADRDALLALADVFALPSRTVARRTEGAPVALREAMVAGLPCVASATGGVVEMSSTGLRQVPPEDPAALRAAIDASVGDAAAGRANRRVGEAFRWSAVGPAHLAAISGAAAPPPGTRPAAR
jgi:glycosyltransferase involved in cell wall biosynthesis